MTTRFAGCQLTVKDFQVCQTMLERLASRGSPLAALLQEKIETCTVVDPEHVDPLVVTLNSRVEYEIDEAPPETRIIVQSEFRHGLVGMTLPITTARGLALLGLRQGQSRRFAEGGGMRRLLVRRLLYQPEARRFLREKVRPSGPTATVIDLMKARSARAAREANVCPRA